VCVATVRNFAAFYPEALMFNGALNAEGGSNLLNKVQTCMDGEFPHQSLVT
jgi:hypothetical protein